MIKLLNNANSNIYVNPLRISFIEKYTSSGERPHHIHMVVDGKDADFNYSDKNECDKVFDEIIKVASRVILRKPFSYQDQVKGVEVILAAMCDMCKCADCGYDFHGDNVCPKYGEDAPCSRCGDYDGGMYIVGECDAYKKK